MIIGFRKSPGAYLDAQYPPNISSDLGIEPSDLMNIYALHRMRQTEPNYQRIKLKNVYLASFYTGFSIKHCIGYPDKTITIILNSQHEILPEDFEGQLRRYALEVLHNMSDSFFGEIFIDYYEKLIKGDLRPYWEEYMEDHQKYEVSTVSTDSLTEDQISDVIDSVAISLDDLDFVGQFEEFIDDDELAEIDRLREYIEEQEIVQQKLAEEILEHTIRKEALETEVKTLREYIQSQNDKIDELVQSNIGLKQENISLNEEYKKIKKKISSLHLDKTDDKEKLMITAELEKENKKLKDDILRLNEKIKNLQEDQRNSNKKLEELKSKNTQFEKENKLLTENSEKLNKKISSLKKQLSQAQKILVPPKKKEEPTKKGIKAKPKPKIKPKPLLTAEDEATREQWSSMEIKELEKLLNKTNMNIIRRIIKPWNIKPKGRTKKDLITAVCDYVSNS